MKLTRSATARRSQPLQLISMLDRPSGVLLIPVLALALAACVRGTAAPGATAVVEQESPAIRDNRLVEPVGFETLGGVLTPVLTPCATPCERTEIFSTAVDNQSQISLMVLRGQGGAAEAHRLGTFLIQSIPPRPRGVPQIAVTLRAEAGALLVAVRDLEGTSVTLARAQ
jgi:molecular chaperone DnaK (HSP70)